MSSSFLESGSLYVPFTLCLNVFNNKRFTHILHGWFLLILQLAWPFNWTLYSRERRWLFAAQFSLFGRLVSLVNTCKRGIEDLNASLACCFAQQSTSALQAQLL